MLVLTRKPSQRIFVGDNVTVTVVRIDGNTVRIGIDAPPEVSILREEVGSRKTAANVSSPTKFADA